MARRYPGSLVARVLVNRYYALRKKYSKPKTKPGRLDFVKHWLLHWEGLLIGGVFVGGLGMTAAKLYVNERMDDIARRGERCRMYTGSCMMAAANLASIQNSLGLYETLFEYAAPRSQLQQEWQQSHQQHMQAAAQQVECWRSRAARWLPASAAAPTGVPEQHGLQRQQQQENREQQAKELSQQQGNACQAITGIHGEVVPSEQQAVSAEQAQQHAQSAPHHQQQQQGELNASQYTLPHTGVGQGADQTQDKQQQQQPQSQQPLLPPSQQGSSDGKVVSQPDQESPAQQTHHSQLQQQPPEQQQQHKQQQQSSWNPVLWFCTLRLRQAQRWLAEEQRAAASADRGARLWQQLAQHAQQQVVKLREQEQQQLLVLMAHTAQLERWKDLDTNTRQFDLWFDLPSTAWLTSWWYHDTPDDAGAAAAVTDAEPAAAAAALSAAAGTRDSSTQEAQSSHTAAVASASRVPVSSYLVGLWRAARGLAGPQGDQDTAADKGQPTRSEEQPDEATKADAAGRGMSFSHHLRIRLLLPAWIPESMEERDFDLLCKDYINYEGTADTASTDTQAAAAAADASGMLTGARRGRDGPTDAADAACSGRHRGSSSSSSSGAATTASDVGGGGADAAADVDEEEEVEIDAGGALVEVFEEALDVIQGLLEAAHDA